MKTNSIFTITTIQRGKRVVEDIEVEGCGQQTIKHVRSQYPRFTRVVLWGFRLNEKLVKLRI